MTTVSVRAKLARTGPGRHDLGVRLASEGDWEAIQHAHSRVFGTRSDSVFRESWRRQVDLDDILVTEDRTAQAHKLVGTAMFYRLSVTVPGGQIVGAAGGGMSLVEPTHRRLGIYRSMYTELLSLVQSRGYPLLIGMPSKGTIYRRFGLGPASRVQEIEIDRRFATFPTRAAAAQTVSSIDSAHAREILPSIYEVCARVMPGAVKRSVEWWELFFSDGGERNGICSERFYFVHPEGYAAYRFVNEAAGPVVHVEDLYTTSDSAHSDLWEALLGLEMFDVLRAKISQSDPLPLKLDDIRCVRIVGVRDELWVRIVDVASALSMRRYASDDELVIQVGDPVGLASGNYRLITENGSVECRKDDTQPDLTINLDDLGSLYLGGFDAHILAKAGRIKGITGNSVARLAALFQTRERPFCGTSF
ncbi:GNAT family N-acetyltransferase [Nocardia abscessus]|uniref:GNAT family N-acetyltransferase n=1 Tax=Nocardia abscessus TaxID=120957 RepID=UPI002454267B|nr:GNAT family N-acetyltransferase [Nocardia abscessus]